MKLLHRTLALSDHSTASQNVREAHYGSISYRLEKKQHLKTWNHDRKISRTHLTIIKFAAGRCPVGITALLDRPKGHRRLQKAAKEAGVDRPNDAASERCQLACVPKNAHGRDKCVRSAALRVREVRTAAGGHQTGGRATHRGLWVRDAGRNVDFRFRKGALWSSLSPIARFDIRYMQTPHHLTAGTPLTSAAEISATTNLFGLGPVPKNQTKN